MKRLTSILLAFALVLSTVSSVFAQESIYAEAAAPQPIIEQIYGGGGKGDTPIANSFIELYNPADTAINLSGYTLSDGAKTLQLNGTIPAKGSYLIIGAAEITTDEFLTYDLPLQFRQRIMLKMVLSLYLPARRMVLWNFSLLSK